MVQLHSTTKKRSFKHLTSSSRGIIYALYNEKKSLQEIAEAVSCHKSTVSRELKRGLVAQKTTQGKIVNKYFPETGQLNYEENRKACKRTFKLSSINEFLQFVETKITKEHWSPDAIYGWCKKKGKFTNARVCTKTIYNYIDLGLINIKNIDLPMKVRMNTRKKKNRENKKVLGKSIEERPKEIELRQEFGHWEIDTVIGTRIKDNVLLTLTERKTRNEIIMKVDAKDTASIEKALIEIKGQYGSNFSSIFKSITSDNGSEFSSLADLFKNEETTVYFTHPYSSWERGTNERHNGMIRRFIKKGESISLIDEDTISRIQDWCNTLPRRILDYRTPEEYFQSELSTLAI